MTRISMAACCVFTVAAIACSSGSPTSPSTGGATIAGTLVSAGGGAASPPTGVTVSVPGTALSTGVDGAGGFRLGGVPPGDVQLAFNSGGGTSTVSLANVANQEVIELRVALVSGAATIVNEVRGNGQGKVVLCHRSDEGYHSIEVSTNAEPAHRGHGDAKPGEPVPADRTKVFDAGCRQVAPVNIKKFTNDQDADWAPGPAIPIGAPVTWTYVVTNNTAFTLTSLTVTDDRGVAVACPRLLPPPGASITCHGSGVAVAGQYRNVGTATATANGVQYTSSDVSHYFGGMREEDESPKIQLCHRTGNGSYHMIEVSVNAERAHRGHGDGMVGEEIPGTPGRVFTATCGAR